MDRNLIHRPDSTSASHLIQYVASLLVDFVQGQINREYQESKRITMDPVRASSLRGFQISFLFPVIRLFDRILVVRQRKSCPSSQSSSAGKVSFPRDSYV